jgi:RNA polymerase sigma factor (sigma-70 family)
VLVARIQRGYAAEQTLAAFPGHPDSAALLERVQAGCAAREQLIQANLRLVRRVVQAYRWADEPADLVQAGIVGLVEAIDQFDPQRGTRLSTYAVPIIRRHVLAAMQQQRPIRLPMHLETKRSAVRRATATLYQQLERSPTERDLAAFLGWSVAQVQAVQHALPSTTSLDAPAARWHDGDAAPLGSLLADMPDTADATDALLLAAVRAAIDTLSERDRTLLRLRFGLAGERCHTLAELGQRLGYSRERVGQLVRRALTQVKTTVVRWWCVETH